MTDTDRLTIGSQLIVFFFIKGKRSNVYKTSKCDIESQCGRRLSSS